MREFHVLLDKKLKKENDYHVKNLWPDYEKNANVKYYDDHAAEHEYDVEKSEDRQNQ